MSRIILGLLVFNLLSQGFCSPVNQDNNKSEDNDDYQSDDYNYDDDSSSDKSKPEVVSSAAVDMSYLEQKEYTKAVNPGENVKLECHARNVTKLNIIMWYRGTELLFQSGTRIIADKRIEVDEQNDLIIKNVNIDDDGEYSCMLFPKKIKEKINLHVKSKPKSVTIYRNDEVLSGTTVEVNNKEKGLEFKCVADGGRPKAIIKWAKNGNTILSAQEKDDLVHVNDEKGLLKISEVHPRHSARYDCMASNENGIVEASFDLKVLHEPVIYHHNDHYNTDIGGDVEIHCVYLANPLPSAITWTREGKPINNDTKKFHITNDIHNNKHRTKLLIKNVAKSDLVSYDCEIENDLGKNKEKIYVGLSPSVAVLKKHEYLNHYLYTDWIVKSRQDLVEYQFLYKTDSSTWRVLKSKTTMRNKINDAEWKIQLSVELQPGDYIIACRVKNTEGWSSDSKSSLVKIPLDEDKIQTAGMATTGDAVTKTSSMAVVLLSIVMSSLVLLRNHH